MTRRRDTAPMLVVPPTPVIRVTVAVPPPPVVRVTVVVQVSG